MLTFLCRSGREVKGKKGHCEMLLRAPVLLNALCLGVDAPPSVDLTDSQAHPYPANYFISNTFN